MRVEHEYGRAGAWAYLAALDVHRAKVFGRCEATTGIAPFARLVDQVMSQPPYNEARKVFWVMDNGSSHRGESSVQRLTQAHPRLVPVHGPVHASWLNQIEIYFSTCSEKCSRRTISPAWKRSLRGCWASSATMKASHNRSNGNSLAPTSTLCSQRCEQGIPKASSRKWRPNQYVRIYETRY